jgi:hypothetical protein
MRRAVAIGEGRGAFTCRTWLDPSVLDGELFFGEFGWRLGRPPSLLHMEKVKRGGS